MAAKRYGLLLTLGGAPNTPHTVQGLPGYYRPDIPTPVGGDGELSLEAAREAAKNNDDLKLVELSGKRLADAEELAEATMKAARKHRTALPDAEAVRRSDEATAMKGA